MSQWMVLSQLYPSEGIPGVEEGPIDKETETKLREEMGVDGGSIEFSMLTEAKGAASGWFLPGDVICRWGHINEERCDVMRPIDDIMFIDKVWKYTFDKEMVESARTEAIENHKWAVRRARTKHLYAGQIVLVDPFGRAVVILERRSGYRWQKAMAAAVPSHKKMKGKVPLRKTSSAWLALKAVHGRIFELRDRGQEIDLEETNKLADRVYSIRYALYDRLGLNQRKVRFRPRRGYKRAAWWERMEQKWQSGGQVPWPVRKTLEKPGLRWVKCSVRDVEEVLGYASWAEWVPMKTADPLKLEIVKAADPAQTWH